MECQDKLVIELGRFRSLVFGKVINQPKELKTINEENVVVSDNLNCHLVQAIKLGTHEELTTNELFLKGSASTEGDIFFKEFATIPSAVRAVEDIKKLVAKVNDPDGQAIVEIIQ